MSKYKTFVFEGYHFDPAIKILGLDYSLDGELHFSETYHFDFDFVDYNPMALDRALQALFFMAGVSYYKTYIPPQIVVRHGELDAAGAVFFGKTWQRGLGEFWYLNQLDPRTPVHFPANAAVVEPIHTLHPANGILVAIGGGKDSLVSIELLKNQIAGLATWSLNHRPQLTPLVERIGLPHYWVERELDHRLLELNNQDALNGHIPISAIFACVGTIVAILSGRRDVVVSNESSASEPNLTYNGVAINHQYSKSLEFEQDFQAFLQHILGEQVRYYSLLRPFSELHIAELFAPHFDTYHDVFSSCNRAFVHGSDHIFWDGTCAKCAFAFLVLTPFVERGKLEALFSSKNLLLEPVLEPIYRQLLGIEGDKPLDCVGEVKESRTAMRLAQGQYPELAQYHFDLPAGYDYQARGPHSIPNELVAKLP